MFSRQLKKGYFLLEALNSFGTVYFFYYFYFYMQKEFGFGNKANLLLAAANGVAYALGVLWAGKLSHRIGYFNALKLGFGTMLAGMVLGAGAHSALGQVLYMLLATLGMCFTWPTLEALVSEQEGRAGLQHMVGLYNVIWAGTGAFAYFVGGAMLDALGLKTLFYVPIVVLLTQLVLTFWLERQARQSGAVGTEGESSPAVAEEHPHSPARTRMFLRMAWVANPFAYIAINTLVAVIPGVAHKLQLSTMLAGFCCSAWCFARMGSFLLLWLWDGWHYRFRFLLSAFVALVGSFAAILMVHNLPVLILAQLLFGGAIGLMYYSSLFYSMDLGEAKSEHGGIHEAVIGLGNFAGPTVGAASLHFLPQYPDSGAVGVSLLLLVGLGGLLVIWQTASPEAKRESRPLEPVSGDRFTALK